MPARRRLLRSARTVTLVASASVAALLAAPAGVSAAPAVPAAGGAASARASSTPSDSCPGAMASATIAGLSGPGTLEAADSAGPDSVWSVGATGEYPALRALAVQGTDHGAMHVVALPDLSDGGGSSLDTVDVVDAGSVWMGGAGYARRRLDYRSHVLHWSGGSVNDVPIPAEVLQGDSQRVEQVTASSDDDVWAEVFERSYAQRWSHYTSLHWDGTTWRRADLPAVGIGWHLAATTTSGAWAATRGKVARWDGTAWRRTTAPPGYSADSGGVLATNGRDLVLAYSGVFLGQDATVARWDGSGWSVLPETTPFGRGPVLAADGTVFVAGERGYDSTYPLTRLVSEVHRWDGTRWTTSGMPQAAAIETQQGSADVLATAFTATSTSTVTAVGGAGVNPFEAATPWLGRWCTSVVRDHSLVRPMTTTLWDSPVTVQADAGLSGDHAIVDGLGMFSPRPLTASGMVDFAYPTAGTFTATVTGVPGSLRTNVPMQVAGYAADHSLSLWWTTSRPPIGYFMEVQRARANAPADFTTVLTTYTDSHLLLDATPAHHHTVFYRCRLVRQDGVASDWSPTITVTY